MFNADSFECLIDLNVKLQGSGKTLDGYIKAFEKKLEVFKRHVDGERFRYLPNLIRHNNELTKR